MANVDLVIFDVAGTTAKDDGLVVKAFQLAMEQEGVPLVSHTMAEMSRIILETMGQRKIDVFRLICQGNQTKAERVHEKFIHSYAEMVGKGELEEIEGVSTLFKTLRNKRIGIAITSGFPRELLDRIIDGLNWRGEIHVSVASDEVDNGRPAPDLIYKSISRYEELMHKKIELDHVMVIGDTDSDIKSGVAAGARYVVGVLTGAHPKSELQANGATHIVSSAPLIEELL